MSAVLAVPARDAVGVAQRSLFSDVVAPPACVASVIKYAGAKGWLISLLVPRLHAHLVRVRGTYVEPFAGSLAMGLSVGWPRSIYADASTYVVNLYRCLVEDAARVADDLDAIRDRGRTEAGYYALRRETWPAQREEIGRFGWAARTIYLNKFCYNGLTRVNRRDGFNVPWGDRPDTVLPAREHLIRAGEVIRPAEVLLGDFAAAVQRAEMIAPADRIALYVDPPYGAKLRNVSTRGAVDRKGDAGVFTGYAGAFSWADQVRLAAVCRGLASRGALVIASNAWVDEVLDLYRDGFALFQVSVRHSVGAKGERRGRRAELIAVSEAHAGVLDGVPAKITRRRS